MTTVTFPLSPEATRRLREKAARQGQSLEVYLQQLAEQEAYGSDPLPQTAAPSFEEMTTPLAEAVAASGLAEDELGDFFESVVKEVRAERRQKTDGTP